MREGAQPRAPSMPPPPPRWVAPPPVVEAAPPPAAVHSASAPTGSVPSQMSGSQAPPTVEVSAAPSNPTVSQSVIAPSVATTADERPPEVMTSRSVADTDQTRSDGLGESRTQSELSGHQAQAALAASPNPIEIEQAVAQLATTSDEVKGDRKNIQIFIGKNAEYFFGKWEAKKRYQQWNWAAAFFGIYWLAYRKMYKYSWFIIGVIPLAGFFESNRLLPENFSTFLYTAIGLGLALYGNDLYKSHVEDKIKEIETTHLGDQLEIELARQGGTNFAAALAFAVGFTLVMVLAAGAGD